MKQTKLAYLDGRVKPPKNIQRKQQQFGTERKLIATPAARVAALSTVSSNIAKLGDSRLKVAPNTRDTAAYVNTGIKNEVLTIPEFTLIFFFIHSGALKKRNAPLMMKAKQLFKGRFKK